MLMRFFPVSYPSRRRTGERGFSIIELLVVVSIIALLFSVVVSSVSTVRQKARDARRTADLQSITIALALYQGKNHYFPCTTQNSKNNGFLQFLVDEGYLMESPEDPINKGTYFYGYETAKSSPTGNCGDIAFIWYYMERPYSCLFGAQIGNNHCHYFFPEPLSCSDPFSALEWAAPDCADLKGNG